MREINRREFCRLASLAALSTLIAFSDGRSLLNSADDMPNSIIPTPTSTPAPEPHVDLFDQLMQPLITESGRQRDSRRRNEKFYFRQVDQLLNRNRVNILLYSYGDTHEPPLKERDTIGSFTFFSYNFGLRKVDLLSLTHDIRAPEIEQCKVAKGENNVLPAKIYRAYEIGGFSLTRKILESATGLSVDFQIAFNDSTIARVIDDAFENIEVEVPMDFEVYPFYLNGEKYPGGFFAKGRERMDGKRAIQFIKTVPVENPDKLIEHNARKHLVFRALLAALQEHRANPLFWARIAWALKQESDQHTLDTDFDFVHLILNNVGSIAGNAPKLLFGGRAQIPEISKTIYIVDPASGDGGVQWAKANAQINEITRKDFGKGKYEGSEMEAMEIPYSQYFPFQADPYSENLVDDYWLPTRYTVKSLLN